MKNLKLFLDDEDEQAIELGLIRLAKDLPAHELFYHINAANDGLNFKRKNDLHVCGSYFNFAHLRFETYDFATKNCIQFISNRSVTSEQKKQQNELFSNEENINFLLPFHREVDYIVKTSDNIDDFSLILLPENFMFPIQPFTLHSGDALYDIIQYYE